MAPRKQDSSERGGGGGRSRSNSGASSSSSSSKKAVPKDSEDYKLRRERNNIAVRKSRQLSRQKAKNLEDKVGQLRAENRGLEEKVQLLSKELGVLKDLFLSTATLPAAGSGSGSASGLSPQEEEVLNELKAVDADHKYSASTSSGAWEGRG